MTASEFYKANKKNYDKLFQRVSNEVFHDLGLIEIPVTLSTRIKNFTLLGQFESYYIGIHRDTRVNVYENRGIRSIERVKVDQVERIIQAYKGTKNAWQIKITTWGIMKYVRELAKTILHEIAHYYEVATKGYTSHDLKFYELEKEFVEKYGDKVEYILSNNELFNGK